MKCKNTSPRRFAKGLRGEFFSLYSIGLPIHILNKSYGKKKHAILIQNQPFPIHEIDSKLYGQNGVVNVVGESVGMANKAQPEICWRD